ncbi:SRPBCC domain-containing protein [Hydrogenophaga sp. A37]|uniref:SRPBCC domain-containing protein n=1 Tax=Hydrogenophaga sp. A37 TaxID=1945864 RepID=UPI000985858A|nr:SRPBCC domain-containing protein [Hydrogenophaga sp. A37]OOG86032.1 hypothetical protein B0E41_06810 [Hydrogenophaga sp. A37]
MIDNTLLTVRVLVQCDSARAWAAYTDPEAIVQWNHAAPEWHCPRAENDLRVGGVLRTRMEARDGSMGFDFEGTYTEVVPLQRLVYALGEDRRVLAVFSEKDGHTELTVSFTPDATFPAEYQVGGWQAILNNYKAFAESAV